MAHGSERKDTIEWGTLALYEAINNIFLSESY